LNKLTAETVLTRNYPIQMDLILGFLKAKKTT